MKCAIIYKNNNAYLCIEMQAHTDQTDPSDLPRDDTRVAVARQFNQIRRRLDVLACLEPGYKIWQSVDPATGEKTFTIDNSLVPSLSRWWYGQSRDEIVGTIEDDINYIDQHFSKLNGKAKKTIKANIHRAYKGIDTMRCTYMGSAHESRLDEIIRQITPYTQQ
jgi:hypothetical protein